MGIPGVVELLVGGPKPAWCRWEMSAGPRAASPRLPPPPHPHVVGKLRFGAPVEERFEPKVELGVVVVLGEGGVAHDGGKGARVWCVQTTYLVISTHAGCARGGRFGLGPTPVTRNHGGCRVGVADGEGDCHGGHGN